MRLKTNGVAMTDIIAIGFNLWRVKQNTIRMP